MVICQQPFPGSLLLFASPLKHVHFTVCVFILSSLIIVMELEKVSTLEVIGKKGERIDDSGVLINERDVVPLAEIGGKR